MTSLAPTSSRTSFERNAHLTSLDFNYGSETIHELIKDSISLTETSKIETAKIVDDFCKQANYFNEKYTEKADRIIEQLSKGEAEQKDLVNVNIMGQLAKRVESHFHKTAIMFSELQSFKLERLFTYYKVFRELVFNTRSKESKLLKERPELEKDEELASETLKIINRNPKDSIDEIKTDKSEAIQSFNSSLQETIEFNQKILEELAIKIQSLRESITTTFDKSLEQSKEFSSKFAERAAAIMEKPFEECNQEDLDAVSLIGELAEQLRDRYHETSKQLLKISKLSFENFTTVCEAHIETNFDSWHKEIELSTKPVTDLKDKTHE